MLCLSEKEVKNNEAGPGDGRFAWFKVRVIALGKGICTTNPAILMAICPLCSSKKRLI